MVKRSKTSVVDIYDGALVEPERLAYPVTKAGVQSFLDGLEKYRQAGYHVGIVDGAYDVPTENHVWSLRDCRHRLAERHFGEAYRRASIQEKHQFISSDKLVLIVTVDADDRVHQKKSYRADKGNIVRPVYHWKERANRVAGFMIPNGKGAYRPVVDIVTVDCDPRHRGTPLESHLTLGTYLIEKGILGTWLLYGWHEWLPRAKALTDDYVIMSEAVYAYDGHSGERASSTAIINRIRHIK